MAAEPADITLHLAPFVNLGLARMAEREGTTVEAVAARMVSEGVDWTTLDPDELGALLDSIPGFREQLDESMEQVRRGETVPMSVLLEP